MKKRITALLLIAVLVFALTGCMQITYHITLNENGTADAAYEMYMSNDYVSMITGEEGGDPFADNKKSAEAAGFKVEDVKAADKTGFKATAKNLELNITDMVNTVGMGGETKSDVQVKKGLFKNVYTLTANIDTTNIMGSDQDSQSMIPILNSALDIKLLITAPSKIESQTGTLSATQPNTYEYKIELGKNNQISLSYSLLNMTNIYLCIGIALILILLLIFFLIKKFKKNRTGMEDIVTPTDALQDEAEFEATEAADITDAEGIDGEKTDEESAYEQESSETDTIVAKDASNTEDTEEAAQDAELISTEASEEALEESDAPEQKDGEKEEPSETPEA